MISDFKVLEKKQLWARQGDDYYDHDDEDDYNEYNNGQCIVRQCNQFITGRRLAYHRALEIIQEEEYLDQADFEIIGRTHRQKRNAQGLLDLKLLILMQMGLDSITQRFKCDEGFHGFPTCTGK